MKERREQGFTWLKMDLGIDLVAERARDGHACPLGIDLAYGESNTQHMFTGIGAHATRASR